VCGDCDNNSDGVVVLRSGGQQGERNRDYGHGSWRYKAEYQMRLWVLKLKGARDCVQIIKHGAFCPVTRAA